MEWGFFKNILGGYPRKFKLLFSLKKFKFHPLIELDTK